MKRLHNLKHALFIAGTALIAGTMFMPWGAMKTHAGPPLVITTPPPATSTTPPPTTPTTPPPPTDTIITPGPGTSDPYVLKSAVCVPAGESTPESVDFTIIAGNNGPEAEYNVQVRDPLPPYLELVSVSASPRGTVLSEPNTVLVDIGTLASGETITIRVSARQRSAPPEGTGINVVTLTGLGQNDRNPSNNTAVTTWAWGCSTPVVSPPTGGDLTRSALDMNALSLTMLATGLALVVLSLSLGILLRRRTSV